MKSQFSARERDVISLLLEGKSNKEIASVLGIANRTVETHLSSIYHKLEVSTRTLAVIKLSENASWKTTAIPEVINPGNPQLKSSADEATLSMKVASHPSQPGWKNMIYVFFSLIPMAIGGVALFLQSHKPRLKTAGFILFGISLFGLLYILVFRGLPGDESVRKELGFRPYLYLSFVPLTNGGLALFLKGRKPWLKLMGFVFFGIALLGLCIFPFWAFTLTSR